MTLLYNLGIALYGTGIRLAAPFNTKAKQFVNGRKNWQKQLATKVDTNARYIWFHCASLGEFEQGRPVLEEIRKQFPEYKIALTFFSPSGYEIRKNYEGADLICYLPMDSARNARTFLNLLKPEKAFFVKYEFWYNYISELNRLQIPLYIISAIFRSEQQFFKNSLAGKWYRKILKNVTHFFVQNEASAELLKSVDIENYTLAGDTRFDRVAEIARNAKQFPIVEKFKGNNVTLIAGSTWKPDEELLTAFINKQENLKTIIAPHEVSESNVNRIQQLLIKPSIRFSEALIEDIEKYDVLIIDSIGILSSLYQYGDFSYIGGGFGVGIHNTLEAATFELPIVLGPNYKKFKEAVDLVEQKGAFSIKNYEQLAQIFGTFIADKKALKSSSIICRKYVEKNIGSTQKIIEKIFNKIL